MVGFMKNKVAKQDFVEQSLPSTRRKQFVDIVKHQFNCLLNIGAVLLLFTLPLILAVLFNDLSFYGIKNNPNFYSEGLLNQKGIAMLNTNELVFGIIKSICYIFIFFGLGGICKILRKLIWSEHIILKRDFLLGLKQNAKNSLLFGVMFALIRFLITYCKLFVNNFILASLILGVCVVLFIPIILIGLVYTSFYEGGFFKTSYHSLLIYIKKIPYILILLPFFPIFGLIYLINSFIIKIGVIIIAILLLVPFILLLWYEIVVYVLDTTINISYYKNLAFRGLYKKNE